MVEGQGYVRSIAYADGIVYAGIGTVGHIVKLDPVTGDKTELPIRDVPGVSSLPFVYGLDARGLPFRLLKRQWNNRIDYIRYGEGRLAG